MREPSHLEAFEFLSQAPGLNDAAELEQHFAKALGAFGFDRYACARLDTSGGGARPLIGVAAFPGFIGVALIVIAFLNRSKKI